MRSMSGDDINSLHPPGWAAAIQWVSIMQLTITMDSEFFEDIELNTPSFYNRLIQLHEFCTEH